MRRPGAARMAAAVGGTALIVAAVALTLRAERPTAAVPVNRAAATDPDYDGVTIPPNIAPLNFRVLEPGRRFFVRITASGARAIEVFSKDGVVRIPADQWRALVAGSRGGELQTEVFAKSNEGWIQFRTVRNRVAPEEIDPYVVYRLIPPVYNKWDHITIRQRDLRSFEERIVLDNKESLDREGRSAESACINCHTFLNHGTKQMLLHMRPAQRHQIPAMILIQDGRARMVDTRGGGAPPAAYISWHPSGRLLAFSRNRLVQMFHTAGEETREVVDLNSDLGLYDVVSGQAYTVPQISRPERLETFPAWSPDGKFLYFSSASAWSEKPNAVLDYNKIRYDLVRVSYDAAANRWGEVETLVSAQEFGRSVSLPQVSPDGRFVLFCGHDYGSFPIYQPSSDLYLLDLAQLDPKRGAGDATPRRLEEINSPRSDSYHSWSSNGRWVLFSSKRGDGVFARLYLSYVEPSGRFHKPFILPQEDPGFYERCLTTFNRAELIGEPVTVATEEMVRVMREASGRQAEPKGEPMDTPWQPLR
ncbi:MAG: hypothetical protein K6T61_00025 [Bryobacteraceae bacterium]|nr:hypothetical protein [Bryobacteraceae bacterium]